VSQPNVPAEDLPEQMRVRREKRARLLAEGTDPYPVRVPRTATIAELRSRFPDLPSTRPPVRSSRSPDE
jgi:lysyl-tRNA synthetase class 2